MKYTTSIIMVMVSLSTLAMTGCKTSDGHGQALLNTVNVCIREATPNCSDAEIAYSGTIEEALSVTMTFPVLGTVSAVYVREGDRVKKGQLLAALNTENWQNSYDMMHAKELQAEDAFRRLQPMHESGSLPEIKWVEVETGLQQAKAAAALAKKNLDDCRLYASVSGIVGRRSIEPGMGVNPALSAITLVRIDTVYAKISVSESEIALLRNGQSAEIIVSALQGARFSGIVDQIGVMADPLVHTYKVKIAVPNPEHRMLPGMLCSVVLTGASAPGGVVVPTECLLVNENGGRFLFVADTTRRIAIRREVNPVSFTKIGVKIGTGLRDGEMVVVSGQQKLSDQTPISYTR